MPFAPGAPLGDAVLTHFPLAVAEDVQPCAINRKVKRLGPRSSSIAWLRLSGLKILLTMEELPQKKRIVNGVMDACFALYLCRHF